MNKDVIYIEPEDDITDIITKIEKAKEKIVALVPPKKAGVFRSIVNIKLIAKAGAAAKKSVVLVTVDPSITKLAAATKLPVAKNLQTAPVIPEIETDDSDDTPTLDSVSEPDDEEENDSADESKDGEDKDVDDDALEKNEEGEEKEEEDGKDEKGEEDEEDEEDEAPEEKKPNKREKKSKKASGNKFLAWIKSHKKLSIFCGVFAVGLIGFLVWAFGFAPAVDITVAIKTDSKNFSESITFTDNLADENAKEGKFYLEQKKLEDTQEVNFEATGEKNVGEKASGDVVVYAYFRDSNSSVPVGEGTVFTYGNLKYVATSSATLSWDGKDDSCDNREQASSLARSGCQVSKRIKVEAANPGSNYNIGASNSGWNTVADVAGAYSDKAMGGGTDDVIKVVQQSDVEKAKAELVSANKDEYKTKLYETIDDKYYVIDSSFEVNTAAAEASPAVDEEVKDGVKPTLKATTTATVYAIDEVKLEEYIKAKAELEENQKIYDIKDIYIESITQIASGSTAKLKAHLYIGPKITETEVVDKVKGKGLGDAQREIRDIYGVSDVKMEPSYPWVMAVPGDSNKVSVHFEIKDQDGNEIKANPDEGEESDDETDSEDNGKDTDKDEKSKE
ncbi:MAG: hypothetical protein Q4F56_01860 [Candidatus Saccharibacteria bacterium]|nr:hypothetical protein [Candidatus Saccharibacteria bacterium]